MARVGLAPSVFPFQDCGRSATEWHDSSAAVLVAENISNTPALFRPASPLVHQDSIGTVHLVLGMSRSARAVEVLLRRARASGNQVRTLATPSSSKTSFSQTLAAGPSLDDFIAGNVPERVVLGNTTA